MKRKSLAAAALAVAALIALTACSGGGSSSSKETVAATAAHQKKGGDLLVGSLPASIDPVATTQRVVGLVAAQVCEGLFASTATLGYKEGLLASWSYDSKLTYDFKLRQGVPFQDGSIMKAADVIASLQRYASSAPGATFGGLVNSITPVGDYEVKLQLKTPSGAIPALLATPDTSAYIMPASLIAGRPASDALQKLVGTGPYALESYTPDQSAKLVRFDKYKSRKDKSDGSAGAKTAWADSITFVPSNPSNMANLLRSDELNVQSQFTLDQVTSLQGTGVKQVVIDNGSYPLLQFNTKAGPMAKQTLRQAVQAAIDDKKVMAASSPDAKYYNLDSSLMPPGSPWYSKAGAKSYNQADAALSKKLQKKAGYSGEALTMLYQTTDTFTPVVIAELKDAGFNIKGVPLDSATFAARRVDPAQWDMFISGGTSYGDPLTVVFMSSGFPGWWNTPEKQSLMAQFTAGATQKERKVTWDKLQALIYEQVPFVRFGGRAQVDAITSDVQTYPPQIGSARGFFNVSLTK